MCIRDSCSGILTWSGRRSLRKGALADRHAARRFDRTSSGNIPFRGDAVIRKTKKEEGYAKAILFILCGGFPAADRVQRSTALVSQSGTALSGVPMPGNNRVFLGRMAGDGLSYGRERIFLRRRRDFLLLERRAVL